MIRRFQFPRLTLPTRCSSNVKTRIVCINPNCQTKSKYICQQNDCLCLCQHKNCQRICSTKLYQKIQEISQMNFLNSKSILQHCLSSIKNLQTKLHKYQKIYKSSSTLQSSFQNESQLFYTDIQTGGKKYSQKPIGYRIFNLLNMFDFDKIKNNQKIIEEKLQKIDVCMKEISFIIDTCFNQEYWKQITENQAFQGDDFIQIRDSDILLKDQALLMSNPYFKSLKKLKLKEMSKNPCGSLETIFPSLETLQFYYYKQTSKAGPNIQHSNIKQLVISNASLKSTKIQCPLLTSVSLDNCLFDNQILVSLSNDSPQIKNINIYSSKNIKESAWLVKIFQKLVNIQSIIFKNIDINNNCINSISNLNKIKTLSLIDHTPFNDINIVYFLKMYQLTTLQISLDLSQDGVSIFFKNFPSVKNLNLITTFPCNDKLIMNICSNMKDLQQFKIKKQYNQHNHAINFGFLLLNDQQPYYQLTNTSILYLSKLRKLKTHCLQFLMKLNLNLSQLTINCKKLQQQPKMKFQQSVVIKGNKFGETQRFHRNFITTRIK